MKSKAGYFNVSSPEITAFDLIKYVKHVGAFHNVAKVLQELSSKINPEKLVEAASFFDMPTIQRTGYILQSFIFTWVLSFPFASNVVILNLLASFFDLNVVLKINRLDADTWATKWPPL